MRYATWRARRASRRSLPACRERAARVPVSMLFVNFGGQVFASFARIPHDFYFFNPSFFAKRDVEWHGEVTCASSASSASSALTAGDMAATQHGVMDGGGMGPVRACACMHEFVQFFASLHLASRRASEHSQARHAVAVTKHKLSRRCEKITNNHYRQSRGIICFLLA